MLLLHKRIIYERIEIVAQPVMLTAQNGFFVFFLTPRLRRRIRETFTRLYTFGRYNYIQYYSYALILKKNFQLKLLLYTVNNKLFD